VNILITGADGFVGRALAARLLSNGGCPRSVMRADLVNELGEVGIDNLLVESVTR
jgi:nucleoside-diphosphate-sugar epimerase